MRNFEQKKLWRSVLESKPALAILAIILVIFGWNVLRLWGQLNETNRNKELAEEKVTALKVQKEKLLADINELNSTEGKERVFRENYGLGKVGEKVIVVVEDKDLEAENKGKSSSFWQSLLFWKKKPK